MQFSEYDEIGSDTLTAISEAHRFNKWMYQTIKPFCKGRIFEFGSGIGNISEYFLNDYFEIYLSDVRAGYCDLLKEKFSGYPTFLGVERVDLIDKTFNTAHSLLLNSFDTVYALNVIEHIEDDSLAIKNASSLLKENGNLIILVPSYQSLYNKFDSNLGHYRRYTKKTLSQIMTQPDLEIIHQQYFNFVGIFGWFLFGKLFGNSQINSEEMGLYNKLVPLIKLFDKGLNNSIGLSTIVVAKKI